MWSGSPKGLLGASVTLGGEGGGHTRFPACFWAVGPSLQHSGLGKLSHCFPSGTSCSQLANWAWLTALARPLLMTTNLDSHLQK